MNFKTIAKAAMAAACVAAGAIPAHADILLTQSAQEFYWQGINAVPVLPAGSIYSTLPFTNTTAGLVSVTFTAECRVISALGTYIHLTILIDDVVAVPTGPDAAFCSGRGVGVGGGRAHQSITVGRALAAGAHSVKINAQVSGAHTSAYLDNMTLLVVR